MIGVKLIIQNQRERADRRGESLEGQPVEFKPSHIWTAPDLLTAKLTACVIQQRLRELSSDHLITGEGSTVEFPVGENESVALLGDGASAYCINGRLLSYQVTLNKLTQSLSARFPIGDLVDELKTLVRTQNPYRGKHLLFENGDYGLDVRILPCPTTEWSKISLPEKLADDIQDNTSFQLTDVHQSNGILLYGPPGTGKSLICQAVIRDALKKGFTACTLYGYVDFLALREFIDNFLSPCVVILEDVDSFTESRLKTGRNPGLAPFLQFLSGIQAWSEPVVTVATTNYIDLIDDAVAKRPMRFNRRYHIAPPEPAVVEEMLEKIFPEMTWTPFMIQACQGLDLTGAHFSEIRRTALTLAKRQQRPLPEVVMDAIQIVKSHFSPGQRRAGFSP